MGPWGRCPSCGQLQQALAVVAALLLLGDPLSDQLAVGRVVTQLVQAPLPLPDRGRACHAPAPPEPDPDAVLEQPALVLRASLLRALVAPLRRLAQAARLKASLGRLALLALLVAELGGEVAAALGAPASRPAPVGHVSVDGCAAAGAGHDRHPYRRAFVVRGPSAP